MTLKELNLKYKYRSSYDQIYKDFYRKCLKKASQYDRAVGYFTSNSLAVLADGLDDFINKDGKIRIIANPHLTRDDIEAIELGYKAKYDVITESLLREFEITEETIEGDSMRTLAWLVYTDKLQIKIAFTKNNSLYHEKFGVFYDEFNNKIAFTGSANETVGGIRDNFEKIDVFWKDSDQERIDDMVSDFEKLWNDDTNGLTIIEIPNIIKEKFVGYHANVKSKTTFKRIDPYPYQEKAIKALQDNNWHGILEMATGTGKTITSLLAAKKFFEGKSKIFLVIIVPFTHLAEQWIEELDKMGFSNITACYGSKRSWTNKLQSDVRDYNLSIIDQHVAITTYNTAASKEFNNYISKINSNSFLIADECHYFGIRSLRNHKLSNATAKVGLSATPARWWDEDGTEFIQDFFNGVVYEYDMKTAIQNGALTEYIYHPLQVELTEGEINKYETLTKILIKLYDEKASNDEISQVNRRRSLIISKAQEKKNALFNIFNNKNKDNVSHTLVYCAPGEVDEITKEFSRLGYRVHRFNSKVELKERTKILKAFDQGSIQILVAIKCLDEGVDVPSTKVAYFLSSTSNPREFVQRRGRILRNHENKNISEIYDFIVLPTSASDQIYKLIASKELPRFSEFSQYAINNFRAREEISQYLTPYNLEYLMDKPPWEVYNEFHEWRK